MKKFWNGVSYIAWSCVILQMAQGYKAFVEDLRLYLKERKI